MRRILFGASFVLLAAPLAVSAQGPGLPRPATSPYLNLLRGGNPAYLNYYGLVRPEQQAMAGLSGLQTQLNASNAATQNAFNSLTENSSGVSTGVVAGFMTHRAFFMTSSSGGGGGGSFGTIRSGGGGTGGGRSGAAVPRR